jgi:hypothetical protein
MRFRPSEPSRRAVLSGLTVATASGLSQGFAAGPIANAQVPAAYRFKLGGFECTVVSDGPLRLGTFSAETFTGYTQERIDAILADNFLDKSNFVVEQNALVVNTGGKLVLIDTGIGFRQVYGPRSGRLLTNLRAASIDPASIDVIAVSHAHPDHVWGLVSEDGKPNFPNAQIHIPRLLDRRSQAVGSGARARHRADPRNAAAAARPHHLPQRRPGCCTGCASPVDARAYGRPHELCDQLAG